MPSFSNGLNLGKPKPSLQERLAGQKRKKTLFDDDSDGDDSGAPETDNISALGGLSKPPSKGPKLGAKGGAPLQPPEKYVNLSALHDAKKRAAEAEKLDASVYDYDAAYDTFAPAAKTKTSSTPAASGPKYIGSLMKSAEVRKRDQLRARERMLQKEREAEGDEFADKEKFVTGAYKQQQEEMRRLEEEEAKREAEEEEKRRKGGGMRGFYEGVLRRENERFEGIQKAAEEKAAQGPVSETEEEKVKSDAQIAAELNAKGAKIAINDDGAVVDKRDLLSAGLNVAKKPTNAAGTDANKSKYSSSSQRPSDWSRSNNARSARDAQRERQTKMLATQLEEMQQKQAEEEEKERQAAQEKVKSNITTEKVMDAKERYLARKREREEQQAKKAKTDG